jgi:membrane protease YdiL (CAAX protease family)
VTGTGDARRDLARQIALILPLALVSAAVLVPSARWPIVAALAVGFVALRAGRARANTAAGAAAPADAATAAAAASDAAWLWAALVPIAVRLAWAGSSAATPLPGLADCGNALSAPAIARAVEAALVIGALAVLAVLLRANHGSLSLRWPSRGIVALSVVGPLVVAPIALVVGPLLTGPFFGPVRIELGIAAAVVPALFLAVSNSALEELTFRGAILGWGSRVLGPTGALVLQAVLFGLTHAGPDFLNPLVALPVLAAVAAGGLIAGLIVQRTGSLLLPLAIHVALDVPIYYAFACRLPG